MNWFQRAFMWLLHRELVRMGAFTIEQVRDFERTERLHRPTPAQLKEAWQEGWSDGYCHATVPDSGDTYSWEQSQTAKHSGTQEEASPITKGEPK